MVSLYFWILSSRWPCSTSESGSPSLLFVPDLSSTSISNAWPDEMVPALALALGFATGLAPGWGVAFALAALLSSLCVCYAVCCRVKFSNSGAGTCVGGIDVKAAMRFWSSMIRVCMAMSLNPNRRPVSTSLRALPNAVFRLKASSFCNLRRLRAEVARRSSASFFVPTPAVTSL